jgi:predicted anti-sigma-YlaC factor YlaD
MLETIRAFVAEQLAVRPDAAQIQRRRARLSRSVVRIQRFSLSSTLLQMIIEGTVTLQGRLNLDVTARTGTLGVNPNALRLLGLRLPVAGPVPIALIAQVSSYLSNRVVHLVVGGTIRSPAVRVEPVSLLTEEAVRFFLERSNVPIP